jgi:hypothetical protein
MSDSFDERLIAAKEKREKTLNDETATLQRVQSALVANAEFNAQFDFDRYWLIRIDKAHVKGESSVTNFNVPNRRSDELYGWALHKLLTQELGLRFEVVKVRLPFSRSFVRVSWSE